MKKVVLALLFIGIWAFPALSVAQFAPASKQAGIEFMTPLVQQTVGLLHERIAELMKENDALRRNLAKTQSQCVAYAEPEVKKEKPKESDIFILGNKRGFKYTFTHYSAAINRQRVQDLVDVGFEVVHGVLPEWVE